MERLPHYYFSWIVSLQKQRYMRDASSGDKTIRGKLLHHSDLWGGDCFKRKYLAAGVKARRITKKRRRKSTTTRLDCGM